MVNYNMETKPTFIGIDPGAHGALAFINPNTLVMDIHDMPMIPVGKSKKRNEVDGRAIYNMLPPEGDVVAYIEDVWSMPHDGHVGAFNFGDRYGLVRGVMMASDVELFRTRPQSWKSKMGCPASKTGARNLAMKLFPDFEETFKRVKDDGRAEAAMIALFGLLSHGIRLRGPLKRFES